MPRPKLPSYRLHKATGQAVVVHKGKSHYLGKFGTPESHAAYDRVVAGILAERAANRAVAPADEKHLSAPAPASAPALLVSELVIKYWAFAKGYYLKNGKPTGELHPLKSALRLLRRHAGHLVASSFGPLALKELQAAMARQPITRRVKVVGADGSVHFEEKVVGAGLSRRTINKQSGRIKRVFRWGAAEQLIDPAVAAALRETPGLKKGRTSAREKPRVRPVPEADFRAVLAFVPAPVASMARVQWLAGCRPQEVVSMRGRDIDRTAPVWEYRPERYKTEHANDGDDEALERVVFLGPQAQVELAPYLATSGVGYLFRPGRSPRGGSGRVRASESRPYGVAGYRQELQRGCRRAGVPVWSPNQLRHSAATRLRRELGLEAAQAVLGHRELGVTQVYAEADRTAARSAMAGLG